MKSSDETAHEILDVAEELFARFGFRKTSIDDIARTARIGKGSVYLHFESKEEICAEVVKRVSDRTLDALTSAVRRARTPAGKLRAFVDAKLTALSRLTDEKHLRNDALAELLPLASAHVAAHDVQERALLAGILRDGVASGAFVVDHPERLAGGLAACLAALDTSTVARRVDPGVRAGIEELVSVLVRGLSVAPGLQTT